MPVVTHSVNSYDRFKSLMESLDNSGKVVIEIVGAKKKDDGKSWCPDCQEAEPIVDDYVSTKLNKDIHLVRVELDRSYFKNPRNPFRTCHKVRLTKVPTLILWKDVKRLEESECKNVELLDLFFED